MILSARWEFRPRAAATALAAVAALAFGALGQWQMGRAAEKRALIQGFETGTGELQRLPADLAPLPRYQRATASGAYDPAHQVLLDNRIRDSRPGVEVLTPLVLPGGAVLLVNRGWLPLGPSRASLPDVAVGAESRTVTGRVDRLPRPALRLDAPPAQGWPRLASYPEPAEISDWLGRELYPMQLLLDPAEPDGYRRDWRPPGPPPSRHVAYALQWWALGATALAIWLALSLKRREAAQ